MMSFNKNVRYAHIALADSERVRFLEAIRQQVDAEPTSALAVFVAEQRILG
jgi:hypothetical protein